MTTFDVNSLGNFSTRFNGVTKQENGGTASNVNDEIQNYFRSIKSSSKEGVSGDVSGHPFQSKNPIKGLPDIKEYKYIFDLEHWQNIGEGYKPENLRKGPYYMTEITHANGVSIINEVPEAKIIPGKRGKETAVVTNKYERIDIKKDEEGNTIISVYNSATSVDDLFSLSSEPVQYYVYNSNGALTQLLYSDGTAYFKGITY